MYIAHIRKEDGETQSVKEHLTNVSQLSARYGQKVGIEGLAYIAGLLHDIGKLSTQFYDYLLEVANNPNYPPQKGSIDHSTAGGKLLFEYFHENTQSGPIHIIAEIIGNVIISHHMGLHDFLSTDATLNYYRRVQMKEIHNFDNVKRNFFQSIASLDTIKNNIKKSEGELKSQISRNSHKSHSKNPYLTMTFLTKFLFSCLIDADRTDARCFEEKSDIPAPPDNKWLFATFYQRLIEHLSSLNNDKKDKTMIDSLREQMSEECDDFAERPSGIYTLSIPTGGGKTLSSLRYALKHSIKFNKERIIYVIPYTSIIEQNADTIREIIKEDEYILEHHSNVIEGDDKYRSYDERKRYQLTKDNWESPLIFTTMVQFLNIFYSGGTRNIRRLHNLANTVIIFDEIQSIPIRCISMFNEAINYLRNVCNSSILLCTATQPSLDFVDKSIDWIDGEIVPHLNTVQCHFKRVEIVDKRKSSGWSTKELANFVLDRLAETSSILVILNTKTVVRNLFSQFKNIKNSYIYQLHTLKCAAHRTRTLKSIKKALANGKKVICVSTQLIEAGVDISFDCVIRSLAGLDSIAQAAGRCNRDGKNEQRNVYVINHREENLSHLKSIKTGAEITERILMDKQNGYISQDLLSSEVMSLYFKNYYSELKNELDFYVPSLKEDLYNLLAGSKKFMQHYQNKKGENFPLKLYSSIKTVGDYFQVIEQQTKSILVPYKKGADIIEELNGNFEPSQMSEILKKSQRYIVNVFDNEFQKLHKAGELIYLLDGKVLAVNENAYDEHYGLSIV